MNVVFVELVILILFSICINGKERCTLEDDYEGKNLHESICYLSCLSNALNKLYADGEQRLFVNEEVYANASRILDDMEGRTGEGTKYLSVISSVMDGKHDNLEKLISYGNEMGDIVAKVGGLFAEVNESVRVVRKEIPGALIKANKYYMAIAEIVGTVWDDVKAVEGSDEEAAKCKGENIGVTDFPTACGDYTCPLRDNVSADAVQKYKDGCLAVTVQNGSVSECLNKPRDNAYENGAVKNSGDVLLWKENDRAATFFQLTVKVQEIFGPLIAPFAAGQPPSALRAMISNITSLYSHFNGIHGNFTSLLLGTNLTTDVDNTNSNI
ncbi:expression site-associated protein 1 (ESAG1) [Trypanosoma brucei equiperdum]|uniref:Expression site-associated protein 1 (ESAG1) n=1 Tax=Trypanosoma brucei equiperdum TaxID=630700 RepID=A0A3L6KVG4_9TRYP|nr:expression site-associated protein 1 (ESAG1) [Trypanosoma brucei equiperdum]RHW66876.1 expression site-associated protein 1 (ESAG1) [Trypanosoma brucei equiperdum]RHW66877.1 expression site-associated protein 1 (ESAG1) [Trypanosoma brucei equiperdum]RHW66888.1 expression site-associated protein 1 (ESAG1) [Trypanosoma brucei equiperdum]